MSGYYIDESGKTRRWTAADEAAYQRDLAKRKPTLSNIDGRLVGGAKARPEPVKPRASVIGTRG